MRHLSPPDGLAAVWPTREPFFLEGEGQTGARPWIDAALERIPAGRREGTFALLTSGSTGHPKLVVGERARAEALARALHLAQDLDPVEETLVLLPLSYSYAFVNQWVWSHVHQRRLRLTEGFRNPEALRASLSESRNAMICLVGAMVPLLLDLLGPREIPGVLRVHFAGGRFPAERLAELAQVFPNARFFNNYGCAEAMPRLTVREETDPRKPADPAWLGEPLPGIELREGEGGLLQFRSPYGAVGWVEDRGWHGIGPHDWVDSGDLGGPDPERGGWRLLGRPGEVFKRYGEKIAVPALLRLAEARWAGGCAAYRDRDGRGEEGWVLVLGGEPDPARVRGILAAYREVPRPHWPLRLESLSALPLLPNGKPDNASLAAAPGRVIHWTQRI